MEKVMRYINELREGENVNGIYYCKVKQSLKTKAGKSYYSLTLQLTIISVSKMLLITK